MDIDTGQCNILCSSRTEILYLNGIFKLLNNAEKHFINNVFGITPLFMPFKIAPWGQIKGFELIELNK